MDSAEQSLSASTIVVYNKAVPDSPELARFYATQRGIAPDHIVGLTCSADEEISREEYDTNIAAPLREAFQARKWWTVRETAEHQMVVETTSIRFVALIKGVPLKIKPTSGPYEGDQPAVGQGAHSQLELRLLCPSQRVSIFHALGDQHPAGPAQP